jgi:hypothetical protein
MLRPCGRLSFDVGVAFLDSAAGEHTGEGEPVRERQAGAVPPAGIIRAYYACTTSRAAHLFCSSKIRQRGRRRRDGERQSATRPNRQQVSVHEEDRQFGSRKNMLSRPTENHLS